MATPLTCRDLHSLGVEGCAEHDPRAQLRDDPHCYCWQEGPGTREHGAAYGPEEYDEQGCGHLSRWTAADGTAFEICCACLDQAGGREAVERAVAEARAEEVTRPWQPSWEAGAGGAWGLRRAL